MAWLFIIGVFLDSTNSVFSVELDFPFNKGETWYVCQGYNGKHSHFGNLLYSVDLTLKQTHVGKTGCYAKGEELNYSANKDVLSPANGTVAWVSTSGEKDIVCINFEKEINAGGKSMALGHIIPEVAKDDKVTIGKPLGTTTTAVENTGNYGFAHIHMQLYKVTDCKKGEHIPFGTAFGNGLNLTYSGEENQWSGTSFKSTSDGGSNTNTQIVEITGSEEIEIKTEPLVDKAKLYKESLLVDGIPDEYEDDINIDAGKTFTKTWQLENVGNVTWEKGYTFKYSHSTIDGQEVTTGSLSIQGNEIPFEQATNPRENLYGFSVKMQAPSEPGTYQEYWKLFNSKGDAVTLNGVYVKITVLEKVEKELECPYKFTDINDELTDVTEKNYQKKFDNLEGYNTPIQHSNKYPKLADSVRKSIEILCKNGIANGYKDSERNENGKILREFGINDPLTRVEFLKMVLEAQAKATGVSIPDYTDDDPPPYKTKKECEKQNIPVETDIVFSDDTELRKDKYKWAWKYINYAVREDIMHGILKNNEEKADCSNRSAFEPNSAIPREQAAKVIIKTLYQVQENDFSKLSQSCDENDKPFLKEYQSEKGQKKWSCKYAHKVRDSFMKGYVGIDDKQFYPGNWMTRWQMAISTCRFFAQLKKEKGYRDTIECD